MFKKIILIHDIFFRQLRQLVMAPKKNTSNYTKDALNQALQAIQSKTLSKRAASLRYGIPRTTLFDKTAGKYRKGRGKI